jgi:hypothetical protein
MTSLLGRIFNGKPPPAPGPSRGEAAYAKAMATSDDLLTRMRSASQSTDPFRALLADIWAQHHNVPFMTTVVEAVEEAKSPLEQRPEDK